MLAGLAIINLIVIAVLATDADEAFITHHETANVEQVVDVHNDV